MQKYPFNNEGNLKIGFRKLYDEKGNLIKQLKIYTQMLADMAGVENLVNLENEA